MLLEFMKRTPRYTVVVIGNKVSNDTIVTFRSTLLLNRKIIFTNVIKVTCWEMSYEIFRV